MSNDETYEGWSNRSTWNVNLLIMNDQTMYKAWLQRSKDQQYTWTRTQARTFARETFPTSDSLDAGCYVSKVNHHELAQEWTTTAQDHLAHGA